MEPYKKPGNLISSWNEMLFHGEESKLGSVKTFCLDFFNSSKMFWQVESLEKSFANLIYSSIETYFPVLYPLQSSFSISFSGSVVKHIAYPTE